MWLYKLTNKINGKGYIGTSVNPISHRISRHLYAARNGYDKGMPIVQALRKYGIYSFIVACIGIAKTHSELMEMEKDAISKHNTRVPDGYNVTAGGMGCVGRKMSDKTRAKFHKLGKRPWNLGLKTGPVSEETRKKQSDIHRGQKAWNLGLHHTEETKKKMSLAHLGGKNANAKKIEFNGIEYLSLSDACRATNLSMMQIRYRLSKGIGKYLS